MNVSSDEANLRTEYQQACAVARDKARLTNNKIAVLSGLFKGVYELSEINDMTEKNVLSFSKHLILM